VTTAVLVPAVLALTAPALAFTMPNGPAAGATVTTVSLVLPAGRAAGVERRPVSPHIQKVALKRKTAGAAARSSVAPGQLLWLGTLLTSMCGFALYLGRELTTRFPAVAQGPARRV
jgi:hypothetical protein